MSLLPEFTKPAELYYDEDESRKYSQGSRNIKIQAEMTSRAVELLCIDEEAPLILDIGCGSGLSGRVLTEKRYSWIGMDISPEMLKIAAETPSKGDLLCCDAGKPFPFKEGAFDYAVSISAVQWLFHSFQKEHIPQKRVRTFFVSLYSVVKKAAVIQVYCNDKQIEILKNEAVRAGFGGNVVVDDENTKNRKTYLVLTKVKAAAPARAYVVKRRRVKHRPECASRPS